MHLAVNKDCARGLNAPLKAGIQAAHRQVTAYLFILADQPFSTPDLINQLIEAHRATSCLLARPVFKERPGHQNK